MSDVMLYGVLRMPFDMAMSGYLSQRQFYDRVQEAARRLEAAEARLTEIDMVTPPSPCTAPEVDALLRQFLRAAYPCCTSIDPRGYRWSDAYLEEARRAALASRPAEVDDEGLPPLPEPKYCADDLTDIFTAEQYRQGQRDAVAADRVRREKLPANASEMVAFIGSHYNSMRDDKPDPNDIVYELTVHDLLSAFRWWFDDYELKDEPSHTTNKENG